MNKRKVVDIMKRLFAKMRKVKMTGWCKLTAGEKILKAIMKLIKIAAIVALVVAFAGVAIVILVGAVVGLAIMSAVGGGFTNASRAYRPGDRYVRFF